MSIINSGLVLSGSADGLPILITATTAPGTLIHQVDGTKHFIWLWAANIGQTEVEISIYKGAGGTFVPDSILSIPPGQGKFCIEPGVLLGGNGEIRIFASETNKITITGFVHKRSGDVGN